MSTDASSPRGDYTFIHDAVVTLRGALKGEDPVAAGIAVDGFRSLFTTLNAQSAARALSALNADESAPKPARVHKLQLLARLLEMLDLEHSVQVLMLLLETNTPSWMMANEDAVADAVILSELAPKALHIIDSGINDYQSFGAVLIGQYGPDAMAYLDELLQRLDRDWQDCSRAPGLTWAVYQIGGLRESVRSRIIRIATHPSACPHAKKTAQMILDANEVSYEVVER